MLSLIQLVESLLFNIGDIAVSKIPVKKGFREDEIH